MVCISVNLFHTVEEACSCAGPTCSKVSWLINLTESKLRVRSVIVTKHTRTPSFTKLADIGSGRPGKVIAVLLTVGKQYIVFMWGGLHKGLPSSTQEESLRNQKGLHVWEGGTNWNSVQNVSFLLFTCPEKPTGLILRVASGRHHA